MNMLAHTYRQASQGVCVHLQNITIGQNIPYSGALVRGKAVSDSHSIADSSLKCPSYQRSCQASVQSLHLHTEQLEHVQLRLHGCVTCRNFTLHAYILQLQNDCHKVQIRV